MSFLANENRLDGAILFVFFVDGPLIDVAFIIEDPHKPPGKPHIHDPTFQSLDTVPRVISSGPLWIGINFLGWPYKQVPLQINTSFEMLTES